MIGCVAVVAFGVSLRMGGYFPDHLTFDEHHFVPNAQNYLKGATDTNDHPPLGKLLIAAAIALFGDSPASWRLAPLVAGLLSIFIVYRLAARLFEDERAGWFAAAFLAVDGFFIAYARTALLDGMLAMFFFASALFIVQAKRPWHVIAASVCVGLAVSIKFTGVVMVPALLWVIVSRYRALRWSAPALLIIPLVYVAQYSLGLHLTGRPAGILAVVEATRELVQHHQGLTSMENPSTSSWYNWFVPLRPLTLRAESVDGGIRVMTTLGHPVLWWSVNAGVVLLLFRLPQRLVAAAAARFTVASPAPTGRFLGPSRPFAWSMLLWLLPLLPWILFDRDSYIYHYLPAYGFGLVLLAGLALAAYRRAPLLTVFALCVVGVVAAFYAPVWAQLSLSQQAYEQRLIFETWR